MNWLNKYIDYKGISVFAFEKKIGVRSTISKAINANSNLGSNLLAKIIVEFPEINPYWLITGDGEMIKNDKKSVNYELENENILTLNEPKSDYGTNFDAKDKTIATLEQFVTELRNDKKELLEDKRELLDDKRFIKKMLEKQSNVSKNSA